MKWVTFYGASIDVSEISHQHLSNILWYHDLVWRKDVPQELHIELDKRFGGIKLPYHPMVSFTYELDILERRGYITNRLNSDVIVDGKWIGKILYN